MDETTTPTADPRLDATRSCTRCGGRQELVAQANGMGTYRCDSCEMIVGFDVESDPVEFLVDRGVPARYTLDVFGDRLGTEERRL
jgi:transcription elongation factor Elf1